ncbi:MAG TPA: hypothetical protein VFL98_02560 [Candidatus Paceibacterota bacterium]|nr:hypothetical protein [Candidatus Paceibacterota bacterium]
MHAWRYTEYAAQLIAATASFTLAHAQLASLGPPEMTMLPLIIGCMVLAALPRRILEPIGVVLAAGLLLAGWLPLETAAVFIAGIAAALCCAAQLSKFDALMPLEDEGISIIGFALPSFVVLVASGLTATAMVLAPLLLLMALVQIVFGFVVDRAKPAEQTASRRETII